MSILKCNECGGDVSEYAEKCPHCGCPIDIIKENQINYFDKIIFKSGKEINLSNIKNKFPESELKDKNKFWDFLMSEYNLSMGDSCIICDIIEFNNFKYPDNFQKAYGSLCARNRARHTRNAITCPYCKSTNVEKLSFAKKTTSIMGLGILSNKIGKTYQCKNCKGTW